MSEGGIMTNTPSSRLEIDMRALRIGGALAGAGTLLASVGTALVGFTVAKVARSWVRQLERSPAALANDKLHQARHASNAAMEAWRSGRPINGAVSR
jgi:hypothetical protein